MQRRYERKTSRVPRLLAAAGQAQGGIAVAAAATEQEHKKQKENKTEERLVQSRSNIRPWVHAFSRNTRAVCECCTKVALVVVGAVVVEG